MDSTLFSTVVRYNVFEYSSRIFSHTAQKQTAPHGTVFVGEALSSYFPLPRETAQMRLVIHPRLAYDT